MKLHIGCLAMVCCLLTACQPTSAPYERTGFGLDTVVGVTIYDGAAQAAADACFDELERLESLLSVTRDGSDIDRINRSVGTPIVVSAETTELLTLGCEVASRSQGAFDITVRPLTALWDFSADTPTVPEMSALQAACAQVDYRNITVEGQTVTLANGGIELGGIAKGYIADRLRDVLAAHNVTSAVIDLGGNIVAHGGKNGDDFRIGIKDPANPAALRAIVRVQDCAVVTSGTYERGFMLDGVRYHHLLDPNNGMPVQNGLASVTIVAEESAVADALSTACFVMGEQASQELLVAYGAQALFIYEDGRLSTTSGLQVIDRNDACPEFSPGN